MLNSLFRKTLRDQRMSLTWWSVGIVALTLLNVLFYPSFSDRPEFNELFEDSETLGRLFAGDIADFTSPEGYLNSQIYLSILPLLLIVVTVGQGTGTVAGEERRGTLDSRSAEAASSSRSWAQ